MNILLIIWLGIIIIALTLPVIMVKKYIRTKNICYILFAIFVYIVVVIGYSYVLQHCPIYYLYAPWFISMTLALFAGVIFFDEKIKPINVVGIMLGIFSMYLATRS